MSYLWLFYPLDGRRFSYNCFISLFHSVLANNYLLKNYWKSVAHNNSSFLTILLAKYKILKYIRCSFDINIKPLSLWINPHIGGNQSKYTFSVVVVVVVVCILCGKKLRFSLVNEKTDKTKLHLRLSSLTIYIISHTWELVSNGKISAYTLENDIWECPCLNVFHWVNKGWAVNCADFVEDNGDKKELFEQHLWRDHDISCSQHLSGIPRESNRESKPVLAGCTRENGRWVDI